MEEKKTKKKKKLKWKNIGIFLFIIVAFAMGGYFVFQSELSFSGNAKNTKYLASTTPKVTIYDKEGNPKEELARGTKVTYQSKNNVTLEDKSTLYAIHYDQKDGYLKENILVDQKEKCVQEKEIYVRTPQNLYESIDNAHLLTLAKKGEKLEVLGYHQLQEDGTVDRYKVKLGDTIGYIYSKYVVNDQESALAHYQPEEYYTTHQNRTDRYGGGSAGNLDYYPVDKPTFEKNKMPEQVYSLYLNSGVLGNVDAYIELAKESKINTFVVDIKEVQAPGYQSPVMQKYSKTNYENAKNSMESYKNAIQKMKNAGFYVIGRIVTFNDLYYAQDHPEHSIRDTRTDQPFQHDNNYWPSPFQREVWEFNVELAKEAVREMGFCEIQFDYVRFPDRTLRLESSGYMDFRNTYEEDKAQAIQRFLQYATDELHQLGVYVSADVFGESAHTYVTAYGQYWGAISNVVDVISGMPYPDHFSKYEYGFDQPVWTVPYDIMKYWGESYVMKRQKEVPTPAIVRTWIQAYDTIKDPYITYDAEKVSAQINGLYDAGLTGGYMTWNSGSNLAKYKSQLNAYKKEYH